MSGCDSTQPDEAECSGCDESLDSATKSGKKNGADNYKKIKLRTVQSQEPATYGDKNNFARSHERDLSCGPFGNMACRFELAGSIRNGALIDSRDLYMKGTLHFVVEICNVLLDGDALTCLESECYGRPDQMR